MRVSAFSMATATLLLLLLPPLLMHRAHAAVALRSELSDADDADIDHYSSPSQQQQPLSKYCTPDAFRAAASCICYLRFIKVAMPFNKSDRRVVLCRPFGPLASQSTNCRYLKQSNFNVFPTLLWLDSFARYCFGSGILDELNPQSKWRPFFEAVQRNSS